MLEGIADSADIENEIAKVMESLEKRISPETRKNVHDEGSSTDRQGLSADHRACFGVANRLDHHGRARAACLGSRGIWFDNLPGGSVRALPGPGSPHLAARNFCRVEQNMLRIERILCPVDFSEPSARAYDSAQSLARHYQAKLFLQHVVDFKLPSYAYYADAVYITELFQTIRDSARKQLQDFAKSHTRSGVQPECFVHEGAVTDSILSFAAAQKVDLIVMGTHGLKGVDRAALGSVAEKVLRKARCPVLVSRKPGHAVVAPDGAQDSIQLHRVIFCTDFSDPARRALEYALSVAAEYDAEITLLHVLEDVQTFGQHQRGNRDGDKATR